jgi:predicted transposase YbfD/YdcC
MICGARAVIAQRDVDQKTNEITQVAPLLKDVDIAGALMTADAMHVQKETARYLVEDKKADYLFTAVKENQPSLFAALDALDWAGTAVVHTAHDRGHGRDETRTLQVLPAPEDLFPHAAQAFLIERAVRDPHDGQLRSSVAALGITSRSLARGGTPEVIATAARGHWDIEALHYVRDVTMREDAQHLRAGSSAQVMAAVRSTSIAVLRMAGFTGTAAGRRWAARNPARPVAVLNLAIRE